MGNRWSHSRHELPAAGTRVSRNEPSTLPRLDQKRHVRDIQSLLQLTLCSEAQKKISCSPTFSRVCPALSLSPQVNAKDHSILRTILRNQNPLVSLYVHLEAPIHSASQNISSRHPSVFLKRVVLGKFSKKVFSVVTPE